MNRKEKLLSGLCAVTAIYLVAVMPVEAKDKDHIENGVYLEEINASGMSKEEAIDAVNETVEQRLSKTITLIGVGNSEVPVQVSELGLVWTNPGIVTEAVSLGKSGNIVKRYKELKNLEQNNKVYDIRYGANKDAIKEILFDDVGFRSRDEKVKLGVAAMDLMYDQADTLLGQGISVILDNNFENVSCI